MLLVAFMMHRAKETAAWPPMISECPDYFEVVSPQVCNNVGLELAQEISLLPLSIKKSWIKTKENMGTRLWCNLGWYH